ncbi:hypothetical protein Pcinc_043665 [Petrolisthes cinctipes]|uniref:Protein kinase domain-containing protein n=1 Tax=Petrolisthes cinctipes TaxID=88211 RepID=A0AAE1EG22_PETCI|nr:hypothetical protein Pcinc_043665 [Petrolisthes cinctipes]
MSGNKDDEMWKLLNKISSDILLYNRRSNNKGKKETQKLYEESIELCLKAGVLVMTKVEFDRWKSRNIIISEYAGETLKQAVYGFLQLRDTKLPQLWTFDVARQLTEAQRLINSCGFLHNDLKQNNICVITSVRKSPHVTIIDFGICTPIGGPPLLSQPMNEERRARNYWLAPEVT